MRIIFVPQFPSEMRYQEWWMWKLDQEFRNAGIETIMLGRDAINVLQHRRSGVEMFSPIYQAIELETEQIKEYMLLDLKDDDILFVADLSFPGFFCNVLFHKRPKKIFGYCHATSLNKFDYFEKVRGPKFTTEFAHSKLFDKIFIATQYHQRKIKLDNSVVISLPFPPFKPSKIVDKKYDIISVSRPTPQKVDLELESSVVQKFGQINRPISNTWDEYFDNLAMSKILLITAREDTFGYQIVDAVINGCIPIARNKLAYPELLPEEYLYNDERELIEKIKYFLKDDNYKKVPKLLCENKMNDFYKNLIKEMIEEDETPF